MEPHIVCPNCGNADGFACGHILSGEERREFGPWFCDGCGYSIRGRKTADGIEIEPTSERKIRTVDVLMLPPQETPVYFVVEGARYEGQRHGGDTPEAEHKRFYYEEHSCPTNWLEPVMVYHDGDSDPHGLIEFVATRDDATFPPDENYGPNDRDRAMIEFIEIVKENGTLPPSGKDAA